MTEDVGSLKAPVGVGQTNDAGDVRRVQHLLNGAAGANVRLAEDGIFGPLTEARLIDYQRDTVKLARPDGVAEPHGPTMRSLSGSRETTGQSVAATDANMHVSDYVARHPVGGNHETPTTRAWIERALPAAEAVRDHWGVPVSVTLAQGALESGWGTQHPGNEYFGVKGHAPDGRSTAVATHEESGGKLHPETDKFRAYDSLEQSADDYGRFLATNHRYAAAFDHKDDGYRFIHEVAKAGYATESQYEHNVRSIMETHNLTQYDTAPGQRQTPGAAAPSAAEVHDPASYWQAQAAKAPPQAAQTAAHGVTSDTAASRRLGP